MIVEGLKLINFRNYERLQLKFHPKLNIFIGENAQGKTNVLESIYLAAMGKSFRTNRDNELTKISTKGSYVKVKVKKINDNIDIEIILKEGARKTIRVNKLPLKRYADLLGYLNVVLFSPEDLKIIKEGPGERRKFMDDELSQMLPKYHHILGQYNKVIQQRNRILKDFRGKKYDLDIWDEQLVNHGVNLMIYRRNFIKRLGILARLMHRKITEGLENLEIIYDSNINLDDRDEFNDIKKNFLRQLRELEEQEKRRGLTLSGPHRDDLIFKINGLNVKDYGSQGQQRTAALSLKLSELELIKGEVGEYPILLLDDVMSELDSKRQEYLLKNLRKIQTFITTTSEDLLTMEDIGECSVFNVNKGKINTNSFKKIN